MTFRAYLLSWIDSDTPHGDVARDCFADRRMAHALTYAEFVALMLGGETRAGDLLRELSVMHDRQDTK